MGGLGVGEWVGGHRPGVEECVRMVPACSPNCSESYTGWCS